MRPSEAGGEPEWGTLLPSAGAGAVVFLARNTFLGRGFPRRILSWLFAALHDGPVDVELWKSRVRLHPESNVVERKALLRPDVFDRDERAVLRDAVAAPGSVFVDVGGNAGLYSLDAALHAGAGGRIVMIEPDERLISRFAFNLRQARAAGLVAPSVDVTTLPVAVGDRDGDALLSKVADEGARSIIEGEGEQGLRVRMRKLAGVLAEAGLGKIDILKIDVEGHEDKVLPPFFAAAGRDLWPGLIIIEHLQRREWQPDCIAEMVSRGYEIFKTTRNNTFLRLPS